MDDLIHIVGEGLSAWEDESLDTNRYSILTQNLMLAEKVSRRQHLPPRPKFKEKEERSFHSAESRSASTTRTNSTTILEQEVPTTTIISGSPPFSRSGAAQAKVGNPRTACRRARQVSHSSSGDWTCRPPVPQRVSSIATRRQKGHVTCRPDLAAFHRRSCQLFSSLDTTLSNANARAAYDTGSPNGSQASTSPSLASSVTTQATSILDDHCYSPPVFPSFHLESQNPIQPLHLGQHHLAERGYFFGEVDHTPRLTAPRSSSRLNPQITSTEAIFWTSEKTRQAEYAKIDAAHGGLKGFVKRILPRSWGWAHGKRRNFCQKAPVPTECDDTVSEADSVRRYRVSIASATQEAIGGFKEHGVAGTSTPMRCRSPFGEGPVNIEVPPPIADESELKPIKVGHVNKVIAKVRSSDALAKIVRSSPSKNNKSEKRAKTFIRDFGC